MNRHELTKLFEDVSATVQQTARGARSAVNVIKAEAATALNIAGEKFDRFQRRTSEQIDHQIATIVQNTPAERRVGVAKALGAISGHRPGQIIGEAAIHALLNDRDDIVLDLVGSHSADIPLTDMRQIFETFLTQGKEETAEIVLMQAASGLNETGFKYVLAYATLNASKDFVKQVLTTYADKLTQNIINGALEAGVTADKAEAVGSILDKYQSDLTAKDLHNLINIAPEDSDVVKRLRNLLKLKEPPIPAVGPRFTA